MKKLKEYFDGFRWVEGDSSSSPFAKNSEQYKSLLNDGCEVVAIPKAEKDAHAKAQAGATIIQKLAALDLPPHTLAMAISDDSDALDKVIKTEALKVALREELNAIK